MRFSSPVAVLIAVSLLAIVWSAIAPHDYATWFFELFLGTLGVAVLVALRSRYPFSPLIYYVAAFHFVVLAAGAKYTYAEMPLFDWLKTALELQRNHFDRVGHFMQGVTPALVTREFLLRSSGIRSHVLASLLAVSVALAFSALYELLEWGWVIAFYPGRGPEWLGMQGDPWDAQGDMLMALLGGALAVIVLGRLQDRQISRSTAT